MNKAKFDFSNQFLNWIFQEKRLMNNFLNQIFLKKLYWIILWIEFYREMNEWIIFWIDICHFWWKAPFLVYFGHFLGNFWALVPSDQYQWFPGKWIELSFELNQQIFFELDNILNWILCKAILNQILNESFFGKIQKLNWIRLGIGHH